MKKNFLSMTAAVMGLAAALTAITGCTDDGGARSGAAASGTASPTTAASPTAAAGSDNAAARGRGTTASAPTVINGNSGNNNTMNKDTMNHSNMNHSMNHAMGESGLNALKALKGKEFDIAFLSQMIAHHQAAVVMAEQALKTASKPETRQEFQHVVDAQTREIARMTGWLKEWYGVEPSKEQQALVNKDMDSMMSMPVTSDAMFFEMMVPHHQGAIDMSELIPQRSARAEVKQLGAQIIRDQKAEIARYHQLMGGHGK